MKVILFCGGYGMRMHNSADDGMPKPMQMVGPRPLLWHVMHYYAHFRQKSSFCASATARRTSRTSS
jgi:glucose-1-phosphate cytidylyltransferase